MCNARLDFGEDKGQPFSVESFLMEEDLKKRTSSRDEEEEENARMQFIAITIFCSSLFFETKSVVFDPVLHDFCFVVCEFIFSFLQKTERKERHK